MSLTRSSLLKAMQSWVQDTARKVTNTDPGDFGTAMDRAVERYSQDRPRKKYATLSGDGTSFQFAMPAGWVEDVSRLLEVRYPEPPATGQREPNVIYDVLAPHQPELVRLYRDSSGTTKLWFQEDIPVTGTNNIVVVFTILHTLDASVASNTSVLASDEAALALLAASFACDMIASRYAETKDAALAVDSVDFRSKSDEYDRRARKLFANYCDHLGIPRDGQVPATGGQVQWLSSMLGGRDRLIRRGRVIS